MIKVTLEFADTNALVAFFSRPQIVANTESAAQAAPAEGDKPQPSGVVPLVAAAPTTPANKRGRKAKETPATNALPGATGAGTGEVKETVTTNGPSIPPEQTPQAADAGQGAGAPGGPSAPIENVTIEQARAAMNEVMQSFGDNGLEKVAEILNGIGFQRISEVTADKYPLVVERCKAMLAGK